MKRIFEASVDVFLTLFHSLQPKLLIIITLTLKAHKYKLKNLRKKAVEFACRDARPVRPNEKQSIKMADAQIVRPYRSNKIHQLTPFVPPTGETDSANWRVRFHQLENFD